MDIKKLEDYAKVFINKGDWGKEAIIINKKIISIDSNNIAAYARLGRCYKEEGKNKLAITVFKKALKISPESTVVKSMLLNTPLEDCDDILGKKLSEIKLIAKEMAMQNIWEEKTYQINNYIIEKDKFSIFSYAILYNYHILTGNKAMAEEILNRGMQINEIEMCKALLELISKNSIITKKDKSLLMLKIVRVLGISVDKKNEYTYRDKCYDCHSATNDALVKCDSCSWHICEKCGACGCGHINYI